MNMLHALAIVWWAWCQSKIFCVDSWERLVHKWRENERKWENWSSTGVVPSYQVSSWEAIQQLLQSLTVLLNKCYNVHHSFRLGSIYFPLANLISPVDCSGVCMLTWPLLTLTFALSSLFRGGHLCSMVESPLKIFVWSGFKFCYKVF